MIGTVTSTPSSRRPRTTGPPFRSARCGAGRAPVTLQKLLIIEQHIDRKTSSRHFLDGQSPGAQLSPQRHIRATAVESGRRPLPVAPWPAQISASITNTAAHSVAQCLVALALSYRERARRAAICRQLAEHAPASATLRPALATAPAGSHRDPPRSRTCHRARLRGDPAPAPPAPAASRAVHPRHPRAGSP